jgi:hypothetical protein
MGFFRSNDDKQKNDKRGRAEPAFLSFGEDEKSRFVFPMPRKCH